jgi:hypothetical protein
MSRNFMAAFSTAIFQTMGMVVSEILSWRRPVLIKNANAFLSTAG